MLKNASKHRGDGLIHVNPKLIHSLDTEVSSLSGAGSLICLTQCFVEGIRDGLCVHLGYLVITKFPAPVAF